MFDGPRWTIKPPLGTQLDRGHPLAQGLVGRWLFNEGGGQQIYDLTGRGHTGTFTGATPPSWKIGKFGPVVDSGGTADYIDCGNILEIDGAARATMYGWIYKSAASDSVGFGKHLSNHRFSFVWFTDDKIYTTVDTGAAGAYVATAAISTYGWNHYVAIYDGSLTGSAKIAVYLNGIYRANATSSGTLPATISATARTWRFGMDNAGGARDWDGRYDNAGLYNRALTQAEALWLYQEPFADLIPPRTNKTFMFYESLPAAGGAVGQGLTHSLRLNRLRIVAQ